MGCFKLAAIFVAMPDTHALIIKIDLTVAKKYYIPSIALSYSFHVLILAELYLYVSYFSEIPRNTQNTWYLCFPTLLRWLPSLLQCAQYVCAQY